jgi:glycolate oxidase FAD binding subunit
MEAVPSASGISVISPSQALAELAAIVGADQVFSYETASSVWQQAIASAATPSASIHFLVFPGTQAELATVVRWAAQNHWGILPCGNGSKLSWGGLSSKIKLVVSTQRLNRVIEHAVGDLTVTVEAGMKFAELQNLLTQSGQFLALDPGYLDQATLGGIVATADAGALRHRYGGVRDMLLGLSFVRADGEIAKAGGRVVKNVAGYDLMKLMTGSYGTLGILTQLTFRLYPRVPASQTVVLTGEAEAIAQATQTLLNSALTPVACDLLSRSLVTALNLGSGLGLAVRFQSGLASVKEQATRVLEVGQVCNLIGQLYTDADETNLWAKIASPFEVSPHTEAITCKIGVRPTAAIATLTQIETRSPMAQAVIHAGSGLGKVQMSSAEITPASLMKLRIWCQAQSGFLSVLTAPVGFKEQIDVWGDVGTALDLMRRIKQQFDPDALLSPQRFVGGI